jgi:hypothetical protein
LLHGVFFADGKIVMEKTAYADSESGAIDPDFTRIGGLESSRDELASKMSVSKNFVL